MSMPGSKLGKATTSAFKAKGNKSCCPSAMMKTKMD